MRGICRPMWAVFIFARLTPAHAGNMKKLDCRIITYQAHPRACGEYYRIVFMFFRF